MHVFLCDEEFECVLGVNKVDKKKYAESEKGMIVRKIKSEIKTRKECKKAKK